MLGFGAAYDIDNPKSMKGSYYLIEMLQKLSAPEKYFLVIFGPASDAFTRKVSIPFFASGYVANPYILAVLYSLCDCIVNPSLIENLPYTCLEAASCGVPSVAFDVGGISDIVSKKETGMLCRPYEVDGLLEGVDYCVRHHDELSEGGLKKVCADFKTTDTVKKFSEIYKTAIRMMGLAV